MAKIIHYISNPIEADEIVSMTYGDLPSKAAFMSAYYREIGEDGEYTMLLRGPDADAAEGTVFETAIEAEQNFDEDDMWTGIKQLRAFWSQDGDDEAGDLASALLGTLGFEWI